jgi:hypothetical protein
MGEYLGAGGGLQPDLTFDMAGAVREPVCYCT